MLVEKRVSVSIRCGIGAREAMHREALKNNANYAEAGRFVCKDCMTAWSYNDFSGGTELESIVCSQCYGERVLITELRLFFEEKMNG